MTLVELGYPRGKFVDIQAVPLGWVAVLQDEATGDLAVLLLDPEGERRAPDSRLPAGGGNAFPVLFVDEAHHIWLAFRHESLGGQLVDLTTGQRTMLGPVYGNSPVMLGVGMLWYQASPAYRLALRRLSDPAVAYSDPSALGRPTGLAYVQPTGDPVLVDDNRLSEPGMSHPQRAGRCTVGENLTGTNRNIARLTGGRECELWPGLDSFTPRIATDGNAFAIVTWGSSRTRLALVTDADFRVPAPPAPPPTPDPPPVPPPKPPAPPPVPPKPEPPMKSREQFYAEFGQVNAFYEAQDGLKRPGGMVIDSATPVRADSEAMAAWGYDLMSGSTPQQCIARIRQSGEWQSKHASDPGGAAQPPFAGPIGVTGRFFTTP